MSRSATSLEIWQSAGYRSVDYVIELEGKDEGLREGWNGQGLIIC